MKLFIKKNKFLLIVLGIFSILLIADVIVFEVNRYRSAKEFEKLVGVFTLAKYDVPYQWHEFRRSGIVSMFSLLFPLVAIVPSIWPFYNIQKSGFIKNSIVRIQYKKYINREIVKSWKAALIFPICLVLTFIAVLIITNFNFPIENGNIVSISGENIPVWTFISELICTFIYFLFISVACINIALIYSRKCPNFVITVAASYFTIVVYSLIAEIIIGPVLSKILGGYFWENGLGILSLELYDTGITNFGLIAYSLFLMISTSFLVFLSYKNKEGVLIDGEK